MSRKAIAILVVAVLLVAGAGTFILLRNSDDSKATIDVNLEIFGNADKNDRIDDNDADLLERYINARDSNDAETLNALNDKISTTFADANQDGKVDSADVEQIRKIVNKTAEYIWLIDGTGNNIRKVGTDIKKIGCEYFANTELCLILGLQDKIAAVDYAPYKMKDFYFTATQQEHIVEMKNMYDPDYDYVNTLDLDILLTFYTSNYEAKQNKLIGTDVLYLGMYNPDITNTDKSAFVQGVLKAGYIFGKTDRAYDYVNWLTTTRDALLNISKGIADKDKPVVLTATYDIAYFATNNPTNSISVYKPKDPLGQAIELAGGKNVYYKIGGSDTDVKYTYNVGIDSVLGDGSSVNYIFLHMVKYTYSGSEMTTTPTHGYMATSADEAALHNAWAYANGRDLVSNNMKTYLVAGEFRNGCTAGVLLGAYMGKVINPDQYASVDPDGLMSEYITYWLGISYDIENKGVFVYTGS